MFLSDLPPSPAPAETIVITASRTAEKRAETPASVTVLSQQTVERLGEPLLASLLRLTPSASLATSGPAGSQSQLRLRGAEANHTLLFVDGIRANDPAAGNEPRFELLSADLGDRIEVVRGPQSALWGSEAVGGVVSLTAAPVSGASGTAETGSNGFYRLGGSGGMDQGPLSFNLAAGLQGARGINAFAGGAGDRDGYRNATLRARLNYRLGPVTLSASGFAIRGASEFDGFDPNTFLRADTADESRNRLAAGRIGGRFEEGGWSGGLGFSHLSSRNRNLLADNEQNRTSGERDILSGELSRRFTLAGLGSRVTVAGERTTERFTASDLIYGGFTDQRRRRTQSALTGEYRGEAGPLVATLALRHDRFSDFKDATTFRAGALARLGGGIALAGNWGEGIAQPSFFDLYGFFPGSFVGNPSLKPERSSGGELSLRYEAGPWRTAATWYRQRLTREIVERFDPTTFLSTVVNTEGRSRREGVELEAGWTAGEWLQLSANAAFSSASEPAGRELRRPRRSGAIIADGRTRSLSYGATLSFTGGRLDRDFDLFPSRLVRLDSYWLANARLGYALGKRAELFVRVANAFDARAVDVIGYRTEGRTVHAGIRLGTGR